MATTTDFDPSILDLAELLGLVTQSANTYIVNNSWFDNPMAFAKFSSDPDLLLKVLQQVLPTSELTDSRGTWALIGTTADASGAAFYLVLPEKTGTTPVSLGVEYTYRLDDIKLVFSATVPLFELSTSTVDFALGKASNPIRARLSATRNGKPFEVALTGQTIALRRAIINIDIPVASGGALKTTLGFSQRVRTPLGGTTLPAAPSNTELIQGVFSTILATKSVSGWLDTSIVGQLTVGNLLIALGVVDYAAATGYSYPSNLTALQNMTPEAFLGTALDTLAGAGALSLPIGAGHVGIVKKTAGSTAQYGFNFGWPGIPVYSSKNPGGPQVFAEVGSWLSGETTQTSWLNRTKGSWTRPPGVTVFLLEKQGKSFSMRPTFEMASVGIDVLPAFAQPAQPLIDVGGFTLAAVEARFYLYLDPSNTSNNDYGVAVKWDGVGLPLSTGLNQASANNPIAQNLLASRTRGTTTTEAVNPLISASLAWVNGLSAPVVQLYDAANLPAQRLSLPVQRTFGPLQCRTIGVSWSSSAKQLTIEFDGSVALPGLNVELIGLRVGIPMNGVAYPSGYNFELDGLAINMKAGQVQISGMLHEAKGSSPLAYEGEALIKMGRFLIAAEGAYTTVGDPQTGASQVSLFIFAVLGTPLGGPPAFFVEGAAAGFGYNRALRIPEAGNVGSFPLVAKLPGGTTPFAANASPNDGLAAMNTGSWAPAALGEYWIAAGVQFSSFRIVNTRAILTVGFGHSTQLALVGISTLTLPQTPGRAYAKLAIGFNVSLRPDEQCFSATAQLTAASYIFNRNCHLTGGAAMVSWYGGAKKGDFVLSVGGYHPAFNNNTYGYPDVERVKLEWNVSDRLFVSGGGYFALTPVAAMAGGWLDAAYHYGRISASFRAEANLLVYWKPFYFNADIGVHISASYTAKVLWMTKRFSVSVGADLNLWGPPTGGQVKVKLSIASITVTFGAANTGLPAIGWTEFSELLPAAANICNISCEAGITGEAQSGSSWIVSANDLRFNVQTAFPVTSIALGGTSGTACSGQQVSIRPMQKAAANVASVLTITISQGTTPMAWKTGGATYGWTYKTDSGNNLPTTQQPESLWGTPRSESEPPLNETPMGNHITGLEQLQYIPNEPVGDLELDTSAIASMSIDPPGQNGFLPLSPLQTAATSHAADAQQGVSVITATVMADNVVANRTALFDALTNLGVNAGTNGPLTDLAQNATTIFQVSPVIGAPGAQLPT